MSQEQMIGTRSGRDRIEEHTVVRLVHSTIRKDHTGVIIESGHPATTQGTIVHVYKNKDKTLDLAYEVEFKTEPKVQTVSVWNVVPITKYGD
jgi:hypothetical protein